MNDLQIYKKAVTLIASGHNVALIAVVSANGSTPGKIGYKMLVWGEKGDTAGTVGGGITEAEITDAAKHLLSRPCCELRRFELSGIGDDDRGICGGSVEFLVETFDASYLPLFQKLSAVIAEGRKGILISLISPGRQPRKLFFDGLEQINAAADLKTSPEVLQNIARVVSREECGKLLLADGAAAFVETIAEQPSLLLFGAGHLAYHIAGLAGPLGFRVTVCDERPEYANSERFGDADKVVVESFEHVFDKLAVGEDSYIVIVTRGHKCDEIVLERALRTNARYIGMIGSRNKALSIMKSLSQKGFSEEKLSKVYCPIGLSIGAVTPEEIALSIVSELTKIRRLGDVAAIDHKKIDSWRQPGENR